MAEPIPVEHVKLIALILWADAQAREQAFVELADRWSRIDHVGADHLFDQSSYYEKEMGAPLWRRVVSFDVRIDPSRLVELRHDASRTEQQLASPTGRRVNIDVGYLDPHKIVLASLKPAGQKIYLGQGVYADLIARYAHKRYQPFEWTFPDLRDGRYDADWQTIREICKRR
jgi:hypothetical protein